MSQPIVLASGSEIRAQLFRNAGVNVRVQPARVDEDMVTASLLAEGAKPRDVADTLAELKAQKVSSNLPDALVIGCDQVLHFEGALLSKAASKADAQDQLRRMSGKSHELLSAAVIYEGGKPQWRHVGRSKLFMHSLSEAYIVEYVERNWEQIHHCVGCYQLEAEGVRLFSRIEGDWFTVLGIPLVELLSYLGLRGTLAR